MRILLGSGLPNDPKISVAIVQKELQKYLTGLGHPTDCIYGDDFNIRIKRATELEFSIKAACMNLDAYDVLDFKLGDGLYPALRMKRYSRRPLIVARSHGLDFLYYANKLKYGYSPSWREKLYAGKYLLWQVRKHLELADLCLLLNDEERDYCRDILKLDKRKLHVIDNGIPDNLLGLDISGAVAPVHEKLHVAVIGSYVPRKINVLPKAIGLILAKYPAVRFTFFGTRAGRETVLTDFETCFHANINVVERYDYSQLADVLHDEDVILFPSLSEGFGMVVFEAMAVGLAVIASSLPSLTGRLEPEKEALFFERMNPEAICNAVSKVIEDPSLLMRLRKNGYERAQTFSWRRVADDLAELYQKTMQDEKIRVK